MFCKTFLRWLFEIPKAYPNWLNNLFMNTTNYIYKDLTFLNFSTNSKNKYSSIPRNLSTLATSDLSRSRFLGFMNGSGLSQEDNGFSQIHRRLSPIFSHRKALKLYKSWVIHLKSVFEMLTPLGPLTDPCPTWGKARERAKVARKVRTRISFIVCL